MDYNIRFWKYNYHLHLYHVKGLHDKLKEEFPTEYHIEQFKKEKKGVHAKRIANYFLEEEKSKFLEDIFVYIANKYYLVDEQWGKISIMAYYQTNEEGISKFHNHARYSTLTATTYIDPPNEDEGGQLEFFNPPDNNLTISPKKDVIYFFPSWLLHRPLPQTNKEPRICLNWGYESTLRPIHKITGDRW